MTRGLRLCAIPVWPACVFLGIIGILGGTLGCTTKAKDQAVISIALTPGNPQVIYVGTSRTVYKSADGGRTWARMSEGLGVHSIYSLVIDPQMTTAVYAGT